MEKAAVLNSKELVDWFLCHRRSLPWRENPSPYAVWISEVMLQQTQVSVVIPYFLKWMRQFPSIVALAQATEEEVIKAWEGLGYYARARRLHKGARYLARYHEGKIPADAGQLAAIEGLGPYTIGALLSFAFHQKAVAVDGNVLRVLCRFWGVEMEVERMTTRRHIEKVLAEQLPDEKPWLAMEALIELGALVCQRTPQCARCPLKPGCVSYRDGKTEELPRRKPRQAPTVLERLVAIVYTSSAVLLRREEKGKVMAGLWEFPYLEGKAPAWEVAQARVVEHFSEPLSYRGSLPAVSHGFTRFRAFLSPYLWEAKAPFNCTGYTWVPFECIKKKPFSSGHRRILHQWLAEKKPGCNN